MQYLTFSLAASTLLTAEAAVLPRCAQCNVPSKYSGEPQRLADPTHGPIPGASEHYSSYWGIERPFPGNITDPIFPTEDGPPGEDDYIWQNLLSAEWIIFEFYQQGIERFTDQDFIDAGMPNNTRRRLMEIRNNEAGHLRIFQNQISPTSIKPGPCQYIFPLDEPLAFLSFVTVIELASMAFLTGLAQLPKSDFAKGAMTAISQTETRHELWALTDLWKADPFAGPADTTFPYANQILYSTHNLVVPGSCPPENPEYPHPRQLLPILSATPDTTSLAPGATITLHFPEGPDSQPVFEDGKQYYAVFFHGVLNASVPIDTNPGKPISVTIPKEFDAKGAIIAMIADQPGAPTNYSVVAGPAVIPMQPAWLAPALVRGG
jgi:hypothetical protein